MGTLQANGHGEPVSKCAWGPGACVHVCVRAWIQWVWAWACVVDPAGTTWSSSHVPVSIQCKKKRIHLLYKASVERGHGNDGLVGVDVGVVGVDVGVVGVDVGVVGVDVGVVGVDVGVVGVVVGMCMVVVVVVVVGVGVGAWGKENGGGGVRRGSTLNVQSSTRLNFGT